MRIALFPILVLTRSARRTVFGTLGFTNRCRQRTIDSAQGEGVAGWTWLSGGERTERLPRLTIGVSTRFFRAPTKIRNRMAKKQPARTRRGRSGAPEKPSFVGTVQQERDQDHRTRRHLFDELESLIRRPVVGFFTSFRYPVQIEDNDADMLEDMLRRMDLSRGLALIVSSPGGDGEAAERIVNLCRAYSGTKEFWAIVPGKAKSAATVICFGASRIIMGPSSELGPVDPQIIFAEDGMRRQLSAYNLVTSYDELFDGAVQTQGHVEPYLQQLNHYDARDIKRYRQAIDLADDITVKILKSGMMRRYSEDSIKQKVARFLQPGETKSHGRPIFREEARGCGLNVKDVDTSGRRWDVVHELYIRMNQHVSYRVSKCLESRFDSFVVPAPQMIAMLAE